MKFTSELIAQLAETVYGQLHLADEVQWPNWAKLTDSDRDDFTAMVYAWLATYRQGQKLEEAAGENPIARLVWQHAETLAGVKLGERYNYTRIELPVIKGEFKEGVKAAMFFIEGKKEAEPETEAETEATQTGDADASGSQVQGTDTPGESETERPSVGDESGTSVVRNHSDRGANARQDRAGSR